MRIKGESDLLAYLALDLSPRASNFHSLLVHATPATLQIVVESTGDLAGWWGAIPPYAASGEPLVEDRYDDVSLFREWGNSLNQEWLRVHGGCARMDQFSMFCPVSSGDRALAQLLAVAQATTPSLNSVWPVLTQDLDAVGWSYIPLSDEFPLALLVCSNAQKGLSHIVAGFENAGCPYSVVGSHDEGDQWTLTPQLLALCGLQP